MRVKHAQKDSKDSDDKKRWGQLGVDPGYVRCATYEEDKELDDSLGLEVLTMRLKKKLMKQLKAAAKREGLGHIAYIRRILTAHVAATTPKRKSA
jgi:hypothetical protein